MAGTSRTLEFMGFFLSLERSNAHEKELEDCRACARSSAAERVTGVWRPQERLHRCLRSGRRYHRRNCRLHNKGRKIRRVLFLSSWVELQKPHGLHGPGRLACQTRHAIWWSMVRRSAWYSWYAALQIDLPEGLTRACAR